MDVGGIEEPIEVDNPTILTSLSPEYFHLRL